MEKLMKMKTLREHLSTDGYYITQRMIKYYIDSSILHLPVYTGKNQALYSKFHLVRLETILSLKEQGMSFSQIKSLIASSEELEKAKAKYLFKDPLSEQNYARENIFEKERIQLIKNMADETLFTEEEIKEKYFIDDVVISIMSTAGLLVSKENYTKKDLILILKTNRYINSSYTDGNYAIMDKIDDVSKITALAKQVGDYLCKRPSRSGAASSLLDTLISERINGFLDENKGTKMIVEYQNRPFKA